MIVCRRLTLSFTNDYYTSLHILKGKQTITRYQRYRLTITFETISDLTGRACAAGCCATVADGTWGQIGVTRAGAAHIRSKLTKFPGTIRRANALFWVVFLWIIGKFKADLIILDVTKVPGHPMIRRFPCPSSLSRQSRLLDDQSERVYGQGNRLPNDHRGNNRISPLWKKLGSPGQR